MKIKSTRFRRESLLAKGTSAAGISRDDIARTIRYHRMKHFLEDERSKGYLRSRTLGMLEHEWGFSLKDLLGGKLNRAGRVNVLNAGSGHGFIDVDIKRLLGEKVFLTSLNVVHPRQFESPSLTRKRRMDEVNYLLKTGGSVKDADKLKQAALTTERIRLDTAKNSEQVDEIRISSGELFQARRQYDAIIDNYGPFYYSKYPSMVLQSYVDALKKDGVIVVPAVSLDEYPQSREALNKTYTNARTGKRYKIERQPQSNNSVWVLGKVLIK